MLEKHVSDEREWQGQNPLDHDEISWCRRLRGVVVPLDLQTPVRGVVGQRDRCRAGLAFGVYVAGRITECYVTYFNHRQDNVPRWTTR